MTIRPLLSDELDVQVFRQHYWLKVELQAFCRAYGLPTSGSKENLAERVAAHLSGVPLPALSSKRRGSSPMPTQFTASTVIGTDWRFTRALRDYFIEVHGASFHFNEAMRRFIVAGNGRTLAEASQCYLDSLKEGPRPIAQQFEYNRHIREYYAAHPGASREEALESWWAKRGRPQS